MKEPLATAVHRVTVRDRRRSCGVACEPLVRRYVDAADLANLTTRLGHPERYTFCADFDESGSVDDSDLAYFAAALGSACP